MSRFDIKLESLLPHRNQMLLVDEVLDVNDNMAVTSATVSEDWPLFDGRAVDALILIEVVAQTAGVNNGWVRIKKHGPDSEKKGWLVGIKQSRFFVDAMALNDRIITRTENQFEFEGYRQIFGTARVGSDIVGEVALQVIQTESAG